jgi:hypothetical protein
MRQVEFGLQEKGSGRENVLQMKKLNEPQAVAHFSGFSSPLSSPGRTVPQANPAVTTLRELRNGIIFKVGGR